MPMMMHWQPFLRSCPARGIAKKLPGLYSDLKQRDARVRKALTLSERDYRKAMREGDSEVTAADVFIKQVAKAVTPDKKTPEGGSGRPRS